MCMKVCMQSCECFDPNSLSLPLSLSELVQSGSVSVFLSPTDGLHSHSVLLDEERGRLLLGTRDSVYLLDPDQLSRAPRKVCYTCNLSGEPFTLIMQGIRGHNLHPNS